MPFVIFRARSCKRLQLQLSGQFLHRHWFTLNNGSWIQNCKVVKMPLLLQLQRITGKRWWRMEKSVRIISQLTSRSQVHWNKSDYRPSKVPLKLALKPPQIHYHRLPLWRKYAPKVKTATGLEQCWVKVKGVNNPAMLVNNLTSTWATPYLSQWAGWTRTASRTLRHSDWSTAQPMRLKTSGPACHSTQTLPSVTHLGMKTKIHNDWCAGKVDDVGCMLTERINAAFCDALWYNRTKIQWLVCWRGWRCWVHTDRVHECCL